MHKSKLYDMAGEIAMDKLMPKPVEITISMRGGGGISSLNENIVYRQRGGGDIGIWEGADILGGQSNIPTYNDTGTDDNNATITPVGIGLKPIGQKVESLLPPINKPPFYTPKQAGHIDIETEDRVMERLKEGVPFHLLSPKEQEVGRVMGISPQGGGRPVRGEYDSYFPKYNSRRNVEQGITLPEGMLQQPPVQGGINQFGFVAFGEKIQKDINKRHKTASDPLLNQIAHTSDSIARGELPKDSGEERIRELQDELEIINKQQIKEKQELEKNIRDEKKNMIWGNRKYREAATGGQTMPGGLSGINKTININGQPHSLAWINPGEASALKAMGGSGKKVDGIPAYYFDDPGYMMEEIESYYDPVDHGTDFTPAPLQYGDVQYLSSDGQTTTPDRFGASGLTSNIPIDLSQADLTNEEAQALGQMHQSQVKSEMDRLLEGVPLSQEGSGRSDFKGLAQLAAQEAIPGASDTWDFEAFAENYPWLMPGAAFVKGIGWIMGKDPNPVVSSYNMGGKIYNVYMDGTVKEQRKDEDYGDDGNESVKKKFPLKKIAAAGKEEEKELTGIAALLDKREKKPTEVEALLPQFKTIVAAGFSEQEAAKMLDVSLADMLKIY